MANDRRRQRLLRQLTRLREIEHRAAAIAASEAMMAVRRSEGLAQRAQGLVAGYADLSGVDLAHDLAGQMMSGERMRTIAIQAGEQASTARTIAEERMAHARRARKKLDQIEEQSAKLVANQAKNSGTEAHCAPSARQLARIVNSKPVK